MSSNQSERTGSPSPTTTTTPSQLTVDEFDDLLLSMENLHFQLANINESTSQQDMTIVYWKDLVIDPLTVWGPSTGNLITQDLETQMQEVFNVVMCILPKTPYKVFEEYDEQTQDGRKTALANFINNSTKLTAEQVYFMFVTKMGACSKELIFEIMNGVGTQQQTRRYALPTAKQLLEQRILQFSQSTSKNETFHDKRAQLQAFQNLIKEHFTANQETASSDNVDAKPLPPNLLNMTEAMEADRVLLSEDMKKEELEELLDAKIATIEEEIRISKSSSLSSLASLTSNLKKELDDKKNGIIKEIDKIEIIAVRISAFIEIHVLPMVKYFSEHFPLVLGNVDFSEEDTFDVEIFVAANINNKQLRSNLDTLDKYLYVYSKYYAALKMRKFKEIVYFAIFEAEFFKKRCFQFLLEHDANAFLVAKFNEYFQSINSDAKFVTTHCPSEIPRTTESTASTEYQRDDPENNRSIQTGVFSVPSELLGELKATVKPVKPIPEATANFDNWYRQEDGSSWGHEAPRQQPRRGGTKKARRKSRRHGKKKPSRRRRRVTRSTRLG